MQGLSLSTPQTDKAELAWASILGESVTELGWSSSGDLLFAGTADGELCAYRTDAQRAFTLAAHQQGVIRVCASPCERIIATSGEDGRVRLWRSATGEPLQTPVRDHGWVERLCWSADGKLLAIASGCRIYVRHANGGIEQWDSHPGKVAALAWAPVGQRLASATNKGVYLWNLGSWQPVRVLSFPGAAVSLAWSHDGRALAAGTQDGLLFIRLQLPGQAPRQLSMSGYPGKVSALSWHPREPLLATCGGSDLVLWELDTKQGKRRATPLRRHSHTLTALAYDSAGRLLASADRGGRLCIWGREGALAFEMELGKEITALAWQPGSQRLAVGSVDGALRMFTLGEEP
jgi:YD repeat-containing protein